MSLSRKRHNLSYVYVLENETICRTTQMRDLGVLVDDHLFFLSHVSSIISQSLRTLGIMSRLTRSFITPHCLLRLYSTHVRSKLEFASVVWNCISITASEGIEHVQKRFVRIIYDRYFGRKCFYEYNLILAKLTLGTLCKRRSIRDIQFLHRLIHNAIDSPTLLTCVHFRIPLRTNSRNPRVFYPDLIRNASPVSRIQHVLNTQFTDVDIFSTNLSFRERSF
uniref:Putative rte ele1 orf1-h 1e-60-j 4 n=1 Tax=Ixodes ricinus TaxID=34613 RepID=A0A0K8RFY2_IXORI